MARLIRRIAPDRWSALAILSCLVPSSTFFSQPLAPTRPEASWIAILLWIATLPLAVLLIAYPQITMTILVRSIRSRLAKMVGAVASSLLALWYAIWAAGADLSGSSTAPLALMFFPIMIQWWAWLAAFAVVLIVLRFDNEADG